MGEQQSIRDDLARDLNLAYDLATGTAVTDEQFVPSAVWLLEDSPVIRRIQAEALRGAATDTRNAPTSDRGMAWFNNDSAKWLEERADRIEKGDIA